MQENELHARLVAALPTPHVAVTLDTVVVDASDAYLNLFGLQRAGVVGKDIVSLFPPDRQAWTPTASRTS